MRFPHLVIVSLAAALVLAGCATQDGDGAGESDTQSKTDTDTSYASQLCDVPGEVPDSVEVSGNIGELPTVSFNGTVDVPHTLRSVVTPGDGAKVEVGDTVEFALALYTANDGKALASNGFGEGDGLVTLTVGDQAMVPGLSDLVACANVGSRMVLVAPASEAFANGNVDNLGLDADATVVLVADVTKVIPNRADGEPQPAPEGLPSVTLDDDGAPTVHIEGDAPAKTTIGLLKLGDGAVVQAGDTVAVQYQGVNWRTGEVFDQSWGRGIASFPTTGVIPGFSQALVGQKVGSQVIVSIAPADGYGPQGGNEQAGIEAADTLVFVIDILDTTH